MLVNGNSVKPKYKCEGFELLNLEVELEAQTRSLPEDIPLDMSMKMRTLLSLINLLGWWFTQVRAIHRVRW